jgi:hypothetical protein
MSSILNFGHAVNLTLESCTLKMSKQTFSCDNLGCKWHEQYRADCEARTAGSVTPCAKEADCEARTVMYWQRDFRRRYYIAVWEKRGEAGLRALIVNVRAQLRLQRKQRQGKL